MPSVRVDATPLRRPAGPARYAMSRTVVTPSGSRRTRRVTPLARGEVYLVEGHSHPPPSAPPLCAPREFWPRQLLAKGEGPRYKAPFGGVEGTRGPLQSHRLS